MNFAHGNKVTRWVIWIYQQDCINRIATKEFYHIISIITEAIILWNESNNTFIWHTIRILFKCRTHNSYFPFKILHQCLY